MSTRGVGAAPRVVGDEDCWCPGSPFTGKGTRLDLLADVGRYRRRCCRSGPTWARTGKLAEDLQAAVADPDSDSWAELNTLSRAEVSQVTGMLVAQLEVEPAEALVRLRAHAFATGRSATDVACDILDRRLRRQAD